jgi:flavin-dependent dehydrogenase
MSSTDPREASGQATAEPSSAASYDVAIIGGALAGASTATLLLRENPRLRVMIIERAAAFQRRVGESTVEASSYFLGRTLGLTQYLNESHLNKQGLRFWFANERTTQLDECSEIGGRYLTRIAGYQVDRATLDAEVLRRAQAVGAELRRPAQLTRVDLVPGGWQRLTVRDAGGVEERIQARWVVDASGVAAVLARQEGWWRPNLGHPTASIWARWHGVKDWDGLELAQKFPDWAAACHGTRATATNHLMGDGWWSWWIPLKGGDMSIGLVYDQRLVTLPRGGSLGERLRHFLVERHPVARELLEHAEVEPGDVQYRKNLPYYTTTYAGDGFALVGDAAGFIDPLYSPGIEWIASTAMAAAKLLAGERSGAPDLAARLSAHNADFARGYHRWFAALYRDKYEYIGEFDLMRLAFLLDFGFYIFFVVRHIFKKGADGFARSSFADPRALLVYWFMRAYNRRFAQIARLRRSQRRLGRCNDRRRYHLQGYTFSVWTADPMLGAMLGLAWLELTEGWRSWWRRSVAETALAAEPRLPAKVAAPEPALASV